MTDFEHRQMARGRDDGEMDERPAPSVNRLTRAEAEEKIATCLWAEYHRNAGVAEEMAKKIFSALLGNCSAVLIESEKK